MALPSRTHIQFQNTKISKVQQCQLVEQFLPKNSTREKGVQKVFSHSTCTHNVLFFFDSRHFSQVNEIQLGLRGKKPFKLFIWFTERNVKMLQYFKQTINSNKVATEKDNPEQKQRSTPTNKTTCTRYTVRNKWAHTHTHTRPSVWKQPQINLARPEGNKTTPCHQKPTPPPSQVISSSPDVAQGHVSGPRSQQTCGCQTTVRVLSRWKEKIWYTAS